jgi:hypothetical protein
MSVGSLHIYPRAEPFDDVQAPVGSAVDRAEVAVVSHLCKEARERRGGKMEGGSKGVGVEVVSREHRSTMEVEVGWRWE